MSLADMLGTVMSETEGYRPLIYGLVALILLGIVQKAVKRWLNIDISTAGGVYSLTLLITVIGILMLALDGKDIPSIFYLLIGLLTPGVYAIAHRN